METNHYDVLGIDKNSTAREIKKAYRDKAKIYHPDVNKEQGASELFKIVNEAYDVLSDDYSRRNYDNAQYRNTGFNDVSESNPYFDIDKLREQEYANAIKMEKRRKAENALKKVLRHLLIFGLFIYIPFITMSEGGGGASVLVGYIIIWLIALYFALFIYIAGNLWFLYLLIIGIFGPDKMNILTGVVGIVAVNTFMTALGWLISEYK